MLITDKTELQSYTCENRLWEGIPGIERTQNGTMFCSFFSGGPCEGVGNYALIIRSRDDGKTWSEPIAVAFLEGNNRCFDPCIWIDPAGKLWFFWGVRFCGLDGQPVETYAAYCENPDDETLAWCEPFSLGTGVMLNKPLVCSDGDILFSLSSWAHTLEKKIDVYRSHNGENRTKVGTAYCPNMVFGEQIIIERNDMTLDMYTRADYGIGLSRSYDGGVTWTAQQDTFLGGPCARFHIRRLHSGKLMLVNHYHFTGRNNLTAMLSDDEGETWYGHLLLDERNSVTYPDAVETADGTIYIIYDHNRGGKRIDTIEHVLTIDREILLARVTEEDIAAGRLVNPNSYLKHIVNKLGAYRGKDKNLYREFDLYDDDDYVDMLCSLKTSTDVVEKLFSDSMYRCTSISAELSGYIDTLCAQLYDPCVFDDSIQRMYVVGKIVAVLRKISVGDNAVAPQEIVKRIFTYVNSTISDDITLDDISRSLHISKYYMCYLFKTESGTTIIRYRNYRRIALAKKLLTETDLSVTEISEKIGFGDASYFGKWFRQLEKISPTGYRKEIGRR